MVDQQILEIILLILMKVNCDNSFYWNETKNAYECTIYLKVYEISNLRIEINSKEDVRLCKFAILKIVRNQSKHVTKNEDEIF